MHEIVILVTPEREQDFILSTLRFRESMPKEYRKHLQGPTVTTEGNRTFVFLPCEGKANKHRMDFLAHGKSNASSRCIHVQFGNDLTTIAYSTDPTLVNEEMKALWIERVKRLEEELQTLRQALEERTNELHEITELRTRDQVLSAALEDLKVIKKNRRLLDVALELVEEYKDSPAEYGPLMSLMVAADV